MLEVVDGVFHFCFYKEALFYTSQAFSQDSVRILYEFYINFQET